MSRWALVVGTKGSDKHARLRELVERLRARGVRVGGVLQEPIDGQEEREGYVARELGGLGRAVLARRAKAQDDGDAAKQVICSYAFDAEALARARGWIARDARASDVVVIDEVSKLEVARGGHHDAIVDALAGPAIALLVVRADQLFAVMERFGLDEPLAALEAPEPAALGPFVDQLVEAARA